MLKLIMGLSGSGKTKTLLSLVHEAVDTASGDVVCIERKRSLTFDIPYRVRLLDVSDYGVNSNALLAGFLYGLHAGNYDITHIFIDDFYKIINDRSDEAVQSLLDDLAAFAQRNNVNLTIIASADPEAVSEGISKYF